MTRIVYVNGDYVPEQEAKVSVFDRAFLFADGVYEVTAILRGRVVDLDAHLKRLHRSLGEIGLKSPLGDGELQALHDRLVEENRIEEGGLYLQITRGVADRDFAYPADTQPTVVAFTQARPLIQNPLAQTGVSVITIPDIRWRRRDIKSTSMLPQAMGRQAAKLTGAYEAWMIEGGFVTEGTSSSAFIIDAEDTLRTQPLGHHLLPGLTRRAILKLAGTTGIKIEERPFTREDALAAKEAFLTATTAFVLPIVTIDGQRIGDGHPGPAAKLLRRLYVEEALAEVENADAVTRFASKSRP